MLQIYDVIMAPLEWSGLAGLRKTILADARGKVLEVGFGTGENLRYYPSEEIKEITLLDQDTAFFAKNKAAQGLPAPELVEAPAEKLPFADQSFDTVVVTLVLCSVSHPQKAISEIHRVLRPGGQLLFLEHIRAAWAPIQALQSLATPLWKHMAGNCHLDRPTVEYLQEAGFNFEGLRYRLGKLVCYGKAVKGGM